jgi:hypothetical protein
MRGRELVVTVPGSHYVVTYFNPNGSPGLLARDIVNTDDPRLPRMTAAQFLAKVWKMGNEKARELGWIA